MLNKILIKLKEKYQNSTLFQEGGILAPAKADEAKVKISFFRLLGETFNPVLDYFKIFLILGALAAILISIAATITGFNNLCLYQEVHVDIYCSDSAWLYLTYSFIKFYILSYFAVKWTEITLGKESFSWSYVWHADRRSLKLAAVFLFLIFLNFAPVLSSWVLYLRTPNPDWRVELIFFTFVSIGFLIPFFLVKIYPFLSAMITAEKEVSLRQVWHKTDGNFIKILLNYMIIFVIAMLLYGNLQSTIRAYSGEYGYLTVLMSEFMYNFAAILIFAFFINNINYQYAKLCRDQNQAS